MKKGCKFGIRNSKFGFRNSKSGREVVHVNVNGRWGKGDGRRGAEDGGGAGLKRGDLTETI